MWPLREPSRLQAPLPALTGPQAKQEACQVLSTTRRQKVAQGMLMSTDVCGTGEGKSESPGNLGESIPSWGTTDHGSQGRHGAISHAQWGAAGQGGRGQAPCGMLAPELPRLQEGPGQETEGVPRPLCCGGGGNSGVLGLSVRVCLLRSCVAWEGEKAGTPGHLCQKQSWLGAIVGGAELGIKVRSLIWGR